LYIAFRLRDYGEFQGQYTYLGCYAVNGLNQYTSAGPASFSYDANACPEPSRRGNLIADGTNGYVYDAENRLVGASGARTATLVYDPAGRLWLSDGAGTPTIRYLYDGDALVGEYDAAGALLRRYVHGSNAGADDPLIWYEGAATRWLLPRVKPPACRLSSPRRSSGVDRGGDRRGRGIALDQRL
jgi:hypothetical protein